MFFLVLSDYGYAHLSFQIIHYLEFFEKIPSLKGHWGMIFNHISTFT